MLPTAERRIAARLPIPWQYRPKTGFEFRHVRLLDLSATGARIEQAEYLPEGRMSFVGLPPALGKAHLPGRVVWSRPREPLHTAAGETQEIYQSGLAFVGLTAEQTAAVTNALGILGGHPVRKPSR